MLSIIDWTIGVERCMLMTPYVTQKGLHNLCRSNEWQVYKQTKKQ